MKVSKISNETGMQRAFRRNAWVGALSPLDIHLVAKWQVGGFFLAVTISRMKICERVNIGVGVRGKSANAGNMKTTVPGRCKSLASRLIPRGNTCHFGNYAGFQIGVKMGLQ